MSWHFWHLEERSAGGKADFTPARAIKIDFALRDDIFPCGDNEN
jgi:hypothetical protein